jgi:hypothetical protein
MREIRTSGLTRGRGQPLPTLLAKKAFKDFFATDTAGVQFAQVKRPGDFDTETTRDYTEHTGKGILNHQEIGIPIS